MLAQTMVQRWSDPKARPLFRGALISDDGCCCAQGDVLRVCGWTDEQLREADQHVADAAVAGLLGISLFHSVLLRNVNDKSDGCPQSVLTADGLARILGPNWQLVLAFARHIDAIDEDGWCRIAAASVAAGDAARAAALAAARAAASDAASDAAWSAAWPAAWSAAWSTAWAAARECVGISHLASPYFLHTFLGDGTAAWIEANRNAVDPLFAIDHH